MNLPVQRATRFRTISRYLMGLALLCACWRLLTPVTALLNPLWSTARLSCVPACSLTLDPVQLLDRDVRDDARKVPSVDQRILKGLEEPGVRPVIVAARTLVAVPELLFFLALALAARAFARSGIERRTLAWLRTAMWAALIWPLMGSVAHALNSWATLHMITGRRDVHLGIYPQDLILGLVVAASLRLMIWALEEALALRADSDDYV